MMNGVRFLLLAVVMTTTRVSSDFNRSDCVNLDWDEFWLIQGEAFHVVPLELRGPVQPDTNITWYKNKSRGGGVISADQAHRIHHQGPALVLLNLTLADSGHYIAQVEKPSGRCYNHRVKIEVVDPSYRGNKTFLYGSVKNSDINKRINCPGPVKYTCKTFSGTYSWYKDFSFLSNHTEETLWINKATKDDEGVYTCICTWTYGGGSYNSSGSRELIHQEQRRYNPTNTEQIAASIVPLVVRGLFVLFFFVFGPMLVKHFAIDLTLFFRPFIPHRLYQEDERKYDAYVIYQTQRMDPATEESLSNFISKTLPSILESQCGYRLFIQGRDDIPGEDRLEMVEDCMSQSRRLIAILTLDSGPESDITDQTPIAPQKSVTEDFDWQVGLHRALMQREMTVILIQLGHTGPQGYTHLPLSLQHLIGRRIPIRWPEGTRGATAVNSRFWKRVRYLMPPKPATRCPQAAAI